MKSKKLRFLLLIFLTFFSAFSTVLVTPARAEETSPPYYVVQPGDTLSGIAQRFGIDIHTLAKANDITNFSDLKAGQQLVLPGLEGFHGEMSVRTVAFGDDLAAFSRVYQIPRDALERLNHITSPYQLFAGKRFILPKDALQNPPPQRTLLDATSLTGAALAHGQSPWALTLANQLPGTWAALPGDVLVLPGTADETQTPLGFPSDVAIAIEPFPWVQGRTGEIQVTTAHDITAIEGAFGEYTLHFFPLEDQGWVALQGIFALAEPGLRPMRLQITLNDQRLAFEQAVGIVPGNYTNERLNVPASLVDPDLNQAENQKFSDITRTATPVRYWQGQFQPPEAPPLDECHPSYFGTRRNYNDTFFWYHTGLDFCGRVGTPIYAPADGVVVFTGTTEIHGNVTVIDHGWGVYTTYCHQSKILVEQGQQVHTNDLIGNVGRTGRVTGPHLHWEVWVGNVPVDPMEWLQRTFP